MADVPKEIRRLPPFEGDISHFRDSEHWPSIKIWLDAEFYDALCSYATFQGCTVSECIRNLLFTTLYGRYTFAQLWSQERHFLKDAVDPDLVFFCRKKSDVVDTPPARKKKTQNLKLYLPEKMRADLKKQTRLV